MDLLETTIIKLMVPLAYVLIKPWVKRTLIYMPTMTPGVAVHSPSVARVAVALVSRAIPKLAEASPAR